MTLRDFADVTLASTIIQIIPNHDSSMCITVHAIFVWTAAPDHNPDVYQYVNDEVTGIFPSNTEPNVLRVLVRHKD